MIYYINLYVFFRLVFLMSPKWASINVESLCPLEGVPVYKTMYTLFIVSDLICSKVQREHVADWWHYPCYIRKTWCVLHYVVQHEFECLRCLGDMTNKLGISLLPCHFLWCNCHKTEFVLLSQTHTIDQALIIWYQIQRMRIVITCVHP